MSRLSQLKYDDMYYKLEEFGNRYNYTIVKTTKCFHYLQSNHVFWIKPEDLDEFSSKYHWHLIKVDRRKDLRLNNLERQILDFTNINIERFVIYCYYTCPIRNILAVDLSDYRCQEVIHNEIKGESQ